MSMKWLFYFLQIFALTSCIEFSQSEYIEKIDTSIDALNQSKLKLEQPVFDSIPVVLIEIKNIKSAFRENLKNDTLPLEIALKIDQVNQIKKILEKTDKAIPLTILDINALIINLKNLKKDINNGSGNRAKYPDNIQIEKEKQTLVVNSVETYYRNCSAAIKSFKEIENELKLFSNELELKKEEQKLIP